MFCLIAAEKEIAQVIKSNLERYRPDWEFDICENTYDLEKYSGDRVNVLILSRFLPGEDPIKLLEKLRLMFYASHIVLLAGTPGERQRAYIKAAQDHGFFNIVTGKLPGDRPYDIFTALTSSKEGHDNIEEYFKEEREQEIDDFEPETGSNEKAEEEPGDRSIEENSDSVEPKKQTNLEDVEALKNKISELEKIIKMLNSPGQGNEMTRLTPAGQKGILVVSAANKGGVGKTTVAIATAMALSRAGVPTVLVDYDLGSPAVANFLDIKGVPGIEALAGRPVKPSILQDLIVQKDTLNVLPGVMNKTIPKFKEGQLGQIVDLLKEMYAVVVCDTSPEFWVKPWLTELFSKSDYVLAVVDQSKLSKEDTRNYAPYLLAMGAKPGKIGIVLNRYSPKLDHPKKVEKEFCAGFKKGVKPLPKIVAVIPENWTEHVSREYKGEVFGLEDVHSQWHRLAENIAKMAGYGYVRTSKSNKKRLPGFGFLDKFKIRHAKGSR